MLALQDHAVSKLIAADQLRSFTKRLRDAILSDADVASVWSPAARVLDIKATLRNKLNNADSQAGHTSTAEVILALSHHLTVSVSASCHARQLQQEAGDTHDAVSMRHFTCCFIMCCVLATCPPSSNCTCLFAEVSSQCSIFSAIKQCAARDVSAG